ncbi:DUF177 domain-containing protein [Sphingomonas piscis]|uniref:DUF177 domain-containing protein n=1 Tax=Sphingomonas piscis TaxID=2714943 RepID=A0A6G7YPS2_9SPHN|nr:DUF177 domain-containing protein [Sphingomonas piscis]QIK78740.1 DUF177 domain-containing protein [Sphingomonas piscis]
MSGFAHRLTLDRIRDGERLELSADEEERRMVAKRLGLENLERFDAHAVLTRDGQQISAKGRIAARLDQRCVVTGEPVPAHVDEAFDILFAPEPSAAVPDDELELGEGDMDVVFHDGAAIDLGEALADTLALSLDPYPRSAGAEAALKEAGVMSEEEAGPFGALADLKRKLEGGES